jgi:hypothetical protein
MLLVKKSQLLIQNAERYELLCESKRKKRENFTFDCSIKKSSIFDTTRIS